MFKAVPYMLSSIFKKAKVNLVKPFLDYEQRPEAVAVSKSFVKIKKTQDNYEIKGGLGAIESSYRVHEYVGFSGVEILIANRKSGETQMITFDFDNLGERFKVLTVQLVLNKGFREKLYAIDLSVEELKSVNTILWTRFKESYRGKIEGGLYDGDHKKISSIRFFLKRSTNAPKDKTLLNYEFKISKLIFS